MHWHWHWHWLLGAGAALALGVWGVCLHWHHTKCQCNWLFIVGNHTGTPSVLSRSNLNVKCEHCVYRGKAHVGLRCRRFFLFY